jgi:hypothetical protein
MTLLQRIEAHLTSSGQSASAFGVHAGGDPRLVFDLRRGRRPRKALRARLEKIVENKS